MILMLISLEWDKFELCAHFAAKIGQLSTVYPDEHHAGPVSVRVLDK